MTSAEGRCFTDGAPQVPHIIILYWYKNHAFHFSKIKLRYLAHGYTKASVALLLVREKYWKPMLISKELGKLIMVHGHHDMICNF